MQKKELQRFSSIINIEENSSLPSEAFEQLFMKLDQYHSKSENHKRIQVKI